MSRCFSSTRPVGRAQVAGQHPQQRRFAGAVGADDRDHLAGCDAQIDRRRPAWRCRSASRPTALRAGRSQRDQSALPQQHAEEERRADRRGQDADRHFRGRHDGAGRACRRQSAARAPSSIEAGSSSRCAGPITSRNRCGTTMPTKPIDAADRDRRRRSSPTPARSRSRFSRSTSTPLWNASASPSTSRSSPRAIDRRRRSGRAPAPAPARRAWARSRRQRAQHPERDVAQLAVVGDEHEQPNARHWRSRRSRCRPSRKIAIEVRPRAARDR